MRLLIKATILAFGLAASSIVFAGDVSRAMFTIGVQDREPVISVDSINSSAYNSIHFFSELSHLSGHNITHQWTYDDKVMFEKSFEVKGPRWRVWTSKTLFPSLTGIWTVNVLGSDRSILLSKTFEYQ